MHEELSLHERLRRDCHHICTLILNTDSDWIDIELKIGAMREVCRQLAPEKLDLFEAVYVSRFNRLRDQWRDAPAQSDKPAWMEGLDWMQEGWRPGV